jgi:tetratricopeptide (TPR) repeat protein
VTAEQPPGIDAIRSALQSGDVAGVLELIERDLNRPLSDSQRHALHLMRARLLSVVGEPHDALSDFDSALLHAASDIQQGMALLARGELNESIGRIDDARSDLSSALPLLLNPSDQTVARQALGRIERDHGDLGHGIDLLIGVRDSLIESGGEPDRLAEATLDLAMALRLAGDTTASIDLLESLIDDVEPPFAARILIQIGTTHGFAGQPQQALDAYARALPLLPEASERAVVRYNRAVVLREHGLLDDAWSEIERALVENAGESARVEFDALLLGGILARELNDYQRSLDLLGEAAGLQPDGDPHGRARLEIGTTLAATGLFGPAIEEFASAAALCADDTDRARALRYRGVARHELGLLDDALADFDAAIPLSADPDDRARGQSTRATLLAALERRSDALSALDAALDQAGDELLVRQLLVQRGSLSSEMGRLDQAVADLERAAGLATAAGDDDMVSRVLVDLGAIHVARDELDVAIEHFSRCVSIARDQVVAHLACMNLGNLHASRGDPDEALRAFDRAAAAAADDRDARAAAFLARGNALLRWGRYGEADTEFKRILTLQPSAALLDQSGIGRRTTEHHLRHIQQTRDELTKVIEAMDQASYRAQPMLQRGMLALAAGDTGAALMDVTRATRLFRLQAERALALGHLALVHASTGNCGEALAAIDAARELDPDAGWMAQLAGEPGWLRCCEQHGFPLALLRRGGEAGPRDFGTST